MNTYITLIPFILCLQIIKVVMLMNVQNVRIILLNVQIIFKKLSFGIVLKLALLYNMEKGGIYMDIIIDIISPIIGIVLVSYLIYFLYLKIKLNKEKIKYYEKQNKEDLGK